MAGTLSDDEKLQKASVQVGSALVSDAADAEYITLLCLRWIAGFSLWLPSFPFQ